MNINNRIKRTKNVTNSSHFKRDLYSVRYMVFSRTTKAIVNNNFFNNSCQSLNEKRTLMN